MALLFYSDDDDPIAWELALRRHIPGLDFRLWPDIGPPEDIDTALVWLPPHGMLASLPNLQAIFSLGAGIDKMLQDESLPDLPLCRMIDPSLTGGMCDYVLTQVLYYHRDMHLYAAQQRRHHWEMILPKPPNTRNVGVMGLGEIGAAVARHLHSYGYLVHGWSRSLKTIDHVTCYAGDDGLIEFLRSCDIVVCLLPLTAETANLLDRHVFEKMRKGSVLIHAGRGKQLNADDLLSSIQSGHLAAATLDVTPEEPLAEDNPLWRHPSITITPHAAAYTLPEVGAIGVVENLRRFAAREPLLGVVDRNRGY